MKKRGWDDLGEWHWNMYNIIYETSRQLRFDAWYWMLGAGALRWPRGLVWRGRREEGSGWGTHVYLWQIYFDIWQNQYNIVKLRNRIEESRRNSFTSSFFLWLFLPKWINIYSLSMRFSAPWWLRSYIMEYDSTIYGVIWS